jgi:AraC-like DNA-binding protein
MSTLEAALRGGAVAIMLLYLVLHGHSLRSSRLSRYTVLLVLGVAAYVVDSAPGFYALDPRLKLPIHFLSNTTPAAFWISSTALFDDEFSARWYHALAWFGLAALAGLEMFIRPRLAWSAYDAAALLCVLFGVWNALAGRAADLVEWRRQFRGEIAIITGLYMAFTIVSQWIWPGILAIAPFSLLNATGVAALVFVFTGMRLSRVVRERIALEPVLAGPAPSAGIAPPRAAPPTGQEAVLLEALRKLMTDGKAYRDDTLSIASLSQSLDVQEYRLRRLINRQLGHRNFNAFVNGYRLTEATAALSDPGQADVPIVTIALDAGFGSIGPFNRAFKNHTGLTPTEYRRAWLAGTPGGGTSPIPESASRS